MLALHVTPADVGDRAAVGRLAADIQEATGDGVRLAFVDQDYTGEIAADAAATEGIALHVVKLPEAKRGFVLLPRRWVLERSARRRSGLAHDLGSADAVGAEQHDLGSPDVPLRAVTVGADCQQAIAAASPKLIPVRMRSIRTSRRAGGIPSGLFRQVLSTRCSEATP